MPVPGHDAWQRNEFPRVPGQQVALGVPGFVIACRQGLVVRLSAAVLRGGEQGLESLTLPCFHHGHGHTFARSFANGKGTEHRDLKQDQGTCHQLEQGQQEQGSRLEGEPAHLWRSINNVWTECNGKRTVICPPPVPCRQHWPSSRKGNHRSPAHCCTGQRLRFAGQWRRFFARIPWQEGLPRSSIWRDGWQ